MYPKEVKEVEKEILLWCQSNSTTECRQPYRGEFKDKLKLAFEKSGKEKDDRYIYMVLSNILGKRKVFKPEYTANGCMRREVGEARKCMRREVLQKNFKVFKKDTMEFIKEFEYQFEAIEYIKKEFNVNIHYSNISAVLQKKRKSTGGFVFEYEEVKR